MGPHSFLLAPKATPVCAARLNEANRALEDTLNNILERLVTPVARAAPILLVFYLLHRAALDFAPVQHP